MGSSSDRLPAHGRRGQRASTYKRLIILNMGQRQIIDKLKPELDSLDSREAFLEEKDVVYFLVEARKMIYHEKNSDVFPAIKFYADWAVHIDKDHVPQSIKPLIQGHSDNLDEFVNMEYLRQEMARFLGAHGLSQSLVEEKYWKQFRKKLINVLSEQPLTLKTAISKFTFRAIEGEENVEYDCEA
jgi:hypothetical protein